MFAPDAAAVGRLAHDVKDRAETRTLAAVFGTTATSVQVVANELVSTGCVAWTGGGEGLPAEGIEVWLDAAGHAHVTLEVPEEGLRLGAAATVAVERFMGSDPGPGGTDVVEAQLGSAAKELAEHANGLVASARRLAGGAASPA
jgi:hypothetical protein